MTDEATLAARIRSGDSAAFDELLRPYRSGMLNMAYRMTGDLEDAREVCQEAMIKIYRHIGSYRTDRSFRNWALKIVVNAAYDHLRRRRRRLDPASLGGNPNMGSKNDPEKRLEDRESGRRVEAALRRLSPREKRVFLLRDAEGYSVRETAEILGSSSISVRSHLSRARKKLREELAGLSPIKGGAA
jgi:RNA polymerase sigma-70 factor (ECF subfamily)